MAIQLHVDPLKISFWKYVFRYPFDWKTPWGYSFCIITQYLSLNATFGLFLANAILTFGNCLYLSDFISDIEDHSKQMNNDYIRMIHTRKTIKAEMELRNKLYNIIKFHSKSIQYDAFHVEIPKNYWFFSYFLYLSFANRFTDINKRFLFFYLACNAVTICVLALTLNAVYWRKIATLKISYMWNCHFFY